MRSTPCTRLISIAAILILGWRGSCTMAAPSLYAVTQSYGAAVMDVIDAAALRIASSNTLSFASSPSYLAYKGLAFGPDGLLYAATQSYGTTVLDLIDPDSFQVLSRNAVTFASSPRSTTYTGLAFGPGRLLYGMTQIYGEAELDVIDPATFRVESSNVVTFASMPSALAYTALAFGSDGQLYAATQDYGISELDAIDPVSFAVRSRAHILFASGPDYASYTGLSFGPDGLLYGVTQTDIGAAELDVIDTATLQAGTVGIVTFASDPNYVRYNGLAFRDEVAGMAVPEPEADAMVGVWLLSLAAARYRAASIACGQRTVASRVLSNGTTLEEYGGVRC